MLVEPERTKFDRIRSEQEESSNGIISVEAEVNNNLISK